MDPSIITAWARALERIAIVGLSGLSLTLGWDLFRRGVLDAQSADIRINSWSARLQRVGPGIFFALFATASFVSAISHPLELTTQKSSDQQPNSPPTESRAGGSEDNRLVYAEKMDTSTDRDVVAAINTLHLVALPHLQQGLETGDRAAISKADQALDAYKKSLMYAQFGQMSLQFYSIHDQVPSDPSVLSKQPIDFQNRYPEIEAWDHDTFLRSR